MWNQHHCLVLLQTENPHQLPSKTKAPWKGVISQPKGVKTQPKGVIFSVVILMFLKTTSFRQPASQMGVQLFGGWFFDYYVSFFLYVLIQFIIIYVNPQSKNCSWAAGFQENITKKWKGFFCLNRLFFLRRQFFLAVQEPPIFFVAGWSRYIYIYMHIYVCILLFIYNTYVTFKTSKPSANIGETKQQNFTWIFEVMRLSLALFRLFVATEIESFASCRTPCREGFEGTSRAVPETYSRWKICRLQELQVAVICPLYPEKLTWFMWKQKSPKLKRKIIWTISSCLFFHLKFWGVYIFGNNVPQRWYEPSRI